MSEQEEKQLTYEEAVGSLEKIVSRLESGDITLEESMNLFQEGMKMAGYCTDKLQKMEEQITRLMIQPDQTVEEENYE